jgi:hypothetical protein
MIEMRYLLVSWENYCIYGTTHRVVTANAIIEGLGSYAYIRGVTPLRVGTEDYKLLNTPGYFATHVCKMTDVATTFSEVPPENVGAEWLRIRALVQNRLHLFNIWESYVAGTMARTHRYKWDEFHTMACRELEKCNPSTDTYTPVFEEYARTLGQPCDIAYKELKLRTETDTLTRFRITALAEKWKRNINKVADKDQNTALINQMQQEFWTNSFI